MLKKLDLQKTLVWHKRTYIMGIVNLTPDSFSGDGLRDDQAAILAQAASFEADADILDLGAESTRPNATPVSTELELARLLPALRLIRANSSRLISVDTMKPVVAEAALQNGADMVNDVNGLADPLMRELIARYAVPAVVMHMRGTPQTMTSLTDYGHDIVATLLEWFEQKLNELDQAGIERAKIIIDPGIGFAKTAIQNLEILHRLAEFQKLGQPILIGLSRKGFVGQLIAQPPPVASERDYGTAAGIALAIAGGADIIRVHNVPALAGAIRVADAISRFRKGA